MTVRPATERKVLQVAPRGGAGYFEMAVTRYPEPKEYKRHRHVIDQIRLTLAGTSPWEPTRATPSGGVLYIPAGTYYGPYVRPSGVELLSIQLAPYPQADFHVGQAPDEAFGATPPRFTCPLEMTPDAFPWCEVPTGARIRHMLSLGPKRLSIGMLSVNSVRLEVGTEQRQVLFVTSGSGSIDGEPLGIRDGIFVEAGESVDVVGSPLVELFRFGLPSI